MRSIESGMSDQNRLGILPARVRPVLITLVVSLAVAACAAFVVRGPAILIDLAGLAQSLWCF